MHLKQYSALVGNILGHTALLAVWLVIEFTFEHWVVPLFPIETLMFRIAFSVARVLFLLAPLTFILIWLRRDIVCAWYGTQMEISTAQSGSTSMEAEVGAKDIGAKKDTATAKIRIPLGEAPK